MPITEKTPDLWDASKYVSKVSGGRKRKTRQRRNKRGGRRNTKKRT